MSMEPHLETVRGEMKAIASMPVGAVRFYGWRTWMEGFCAAVWALRVAQASPAQYPEQDCAWLSAVIGVFLFYPFCSGGINCKKR